MKRMMMGLIVVALCAAPAFAQELPGYQSEQDWNEFHRPAKVFAVWGFHNALEGVYRLAQAQGLDDEFVSWLRELPVQNRRIATQVDAIDRVFENTDSEITVWAAMSDVIIMGSDGMPEPNEDRSPIERDDLSEPEVSW